MGSVDEIKSRLSIEEVIGDYIELRRASGSFKARCPFHEEKTASFMVSPEKQIWHCFGCNEGGDMFTFIEKHEGVDFKEAAEILARKAGIPFHFLADAARKPKESLFGAHEEAVRWFCSQLNVQNAETEKIAAYITRRGVLRESVLAWSLGYAPDAWDMLYKHLTEKKYTKSDLVSGGLIVEREGKTYDRFRRRLMFPIFDLQGRVVAFTARSLAGVTHTEEEVGGKYINSPQTPIYNKSQILYGLHMAKQEIKKRGYVVVVEGNMDVIMSHQAGIKNCVAVSGTALTPDQLALLRRFTTNIMLAFDADAAGSQAAFRGITAAWDSDMNVKVIMLKDGKDPADIIQQDPEKWKSAIRNAIGVVDYYFEEVFARVDLSRADHKKIAAQKITAIIARLKTRIEQTHYIQLLSAKISIPERILADMVAKPANPPIEARTKLRQALPPRAHSPADHIISFVAHHPMYIPVLIDSLETEQMPAPLQPLYKKLIVQYTIGDEQTIRTLARTLDPNELILWSELALRGETLYAHLTPHEREIEFHALLARIQREYFTDKLKSITDELSRAEAEGRVTDVPALMEEYQRYHKRRTSLGD